MKHLERNSDRRGGNSEWYTPPAIIEKARLVLGGIELDPASHAIPQEWIQARRYFTIADDALLHNWRARSIWLNPPYSRGVIDKFIAWLCAADCEAWLALVNNATDTKWAQRLLSASDAVCFLRGRVRFQTAESGGGKPPLQGQMLCYHGRQSAKFRSVFEQDGVILDK